MGCEHECFNEHRIEELENSLRQMQERQSDRHKEFYERIGELERKTALSENDLNHIKSTVDDMNNNIKTLMEIPGKRYDTIIVCVITAIASAIIGFMLNSILPV